jgi:hypothetical protein
VGGAVLPSAPVAILGSRDKPGNDGRERSLKPSILQDAG